MTLVGRTIGRYRILEQLGQGGMSVVYKGLDTKLQREVAVKVLHPHLAAREESRKRLDREARAVARLHHPNILEVFDFSGADAAEAYLVTEYIRGKTLRQFLSEESLEPPEIAAMVVHEIAGALAHAHEHGVIHRDLKPENVMLRDDGVLKLMDFGIAKLLEGEEKMTMTGALVGSPAHMAPEIIEGEPAGAEADVFSLGTMLYLFATGRLPFTASNTTATLRKILDCQYDDPRQLVPTCSDELAEIIGGCLVRAPAQRFANAAKLREPLAAWLGELGLTRVHEELPRFFSSPGTYRNELNERVVKALITQSEKWIAEKRQAKALSSLNQVLARAPNHSRALELLAQMRVQKARAQRTRRAVRAAWVVGTLVVVGAGVARGVAVASRVEDTRVPLVRSPLDVKMPASLYPAPPVPPPDAAPQEVPERAPDPPPVLKVDPGLRKPAGEPLAKLAMKPPLLENTALEVKVNVRPFGLLAVDGVPRGTDALAVHTLKLAPGRHQFKVSCELCVSGGSTVTVDVQPGRENAINLPAPLLPSLLTFEGFPPEAIARVGAETRTVAETHARPFRIETPREGSQSMRHVVPYEVQLECERLQSGTIALLPGKAGVVERTP